MKTQRADCPRIQFDDVHVDYRRGKVVVEALRGVSLSVFAGEFVAVSGPSGSGKSTLLRAVAGLSRITSGTVSFGGRSIGDLGQLELSLLRRRDVGIVHQLFNLLPDLSAADNVGFPLDLDGFDHRIVRERSITELNRLGIGELSERMPEELSGGEQLRVALARALVIRPMVLLADEPTGALDQAASEQVMSIFRELNREGTTILLVTHNPGISACAQRTITIVDGRIRENQSRESA